MILCIWSFVSYRDEMNTYMGVEILKEEEKMQLQEELEIDLSEFITYDKEKASVDSKTKTIYVTANIEKGTMIGDIKSKLT